MRAVLHRCAEQGARRGGTRPIWKTARARNHDPRLSLDPASRPRRHRLPDRRTGRRDRADIQSATRDAFTGKISEIIALMAAQIGKAPRRSGGARRYDLRDHGRRAAIGARGQRQAIVRSTSIWRTRWRLRLPLRMNADAYECQATVQFPSRQPSQSPSTATMWRWDIPMVYLSASRIFGRVVAIHRGTWSGSARRCCVRNCRLRGSPACRRARETRRHASRWRARRERRTSVGLGIGHVNTCAPIGRHGFSFTIGRTKWGASAPL